MLPQWLCGRERDSPSRAPARGPPRDHGTHFGVTEVTDEVSQRRRCWATIVPPTSGVGRILTAPARFWTPIRHSGALEALPSPTHALAFNNINQHVSR